MVAVKIEPSEIDGNELNDEIQPITAVKIEPEFFDLGHNLCGMDVGYEPPVVVKTEPIDRIESNQTATILSSTKSKDQQKVGCDAPSSMSTSYGTSLQKTRLQKYSV